MEANMSENFENELSRSPEEIESKIDELYAYDDYSHGPRGDNKKYKHQGWIDALRWIQGTDTVEEP